MKSGVEDASSAPNTFEPRLRAPLNVEWEITNACNLRCKHCYVSAGEGLDSELTTNEALKLVKELDEIGVTDITISGGEPLLRKDIWKILKETNRRQIPVILYTNGTLLNRAKMSKLVACGAKMISVSLNGALPETHNFVQNSPTFDKVIEAMRTVKSSNIGLQILFTLMRINTNEIDDLFRLGEERKVDAICIYPFYPAGRGRNALDKLKLDPKSVPNLLATIARKARKYPFKLYIGGCLSRRYFPTRGSLLLKGAPCSKLMAVIAADGRLRPCNFLPFRTKHGVRDKTLRTLWKDPLLERIRNWNELTQPNCSQCNDFPVCLGTCLSIHLQKHENANLQSKLEQLSWNP